MAETLETPTRRGITQLDVWAAADAVVAEGRRPTIDAVRQQLGRGSPNTVMAHLDSWFAHLADRLNGTGPATPTLPGPVAAAAVHLWEAALASARATADDDLGGQRKDLDAKRAALEAASLALDHRAAEMEARVEAAHAVARSAGEERAAADRREALAQERLVRLEKQLSQLTQELERGAAEKRALQEQIADGRQRAATERIKAEERLAGQERHWLTEVERARAETLKAAKARADAEVSQRAEALGLKARLEHLETDAAGLRAELAAAKIAAAKSSAEAATLREALTGRTKRLRTAARGPGIKGLRGSG